MKLLKDLCLDCLALNLSGNITCMSRGLAPVHKELLLERLVNHDRLTEDYLPHITYNLFSPAMRHLVMNRCSQVTDDLLQLLSFSACKLTHLSITGCKSVTDVGLARLMKDQTELTVVKLKGLPQLTAKGLTTLCSPLLEILNLKSSGVTSEAIRMVLRNNTTVRHLTISQCRNVDHKVLSLVADSLGPKLLPHLERPAAPLHVRIISSCFPKPSEDAPLLARLWKQEMSTRWMTLVLCTCPVSVQTLKKKAGLRCRLNIHGNNRVTAEALKQVFEHCRQLSDVDLSFCTQLGDTDVLGVLPLTVRTLSLCGVQLTDADRLASVLKRLTGLRVVRLSGVPAVTDDSLEEVLAAIGDQLEVLDLSGGVTSSLTDAGLSSVVTHCHNLTELHVSMHKYVTAASLLPMLAEPQRAARLRRLNLSCKSLDAEVLESLSSRCVSLELLELSGVMHVTDEFLSTVANHCPRLRHIGIKGCRQVTDEGLCALACRCLELTCVVLSGIHRLTDRSIFALANGCPHIGEIYVSGCNMITRAAIRYLVDTSLPRVHWEHRVPSLDPEMLMVHNLDTGHYCRADQQP